MSIVPARRVCSLARPKTGVEEHTHGTRRGAIPLEHVRVEELAVTGRLEHAVPPQHHARAAGEAPVLRARVRGTLRRVVRTREEVAAHRAARVAVRNAAVAARAALLGCLPAAAGRGGDHGSLVVAIRGRDEHMEGTAVLAGIGRGGAVDGRPPQGTKVIGGRGWIAAVGGWIDDRIALNVDVEGRAGGGVVAYGGTTGSVVGLEGAHTKVRSLGDGGVEVPERKSVAWRSGCGGGRRVIGCISEEASFGVWYGRGSVSGRVCGAGRWVNIRSDRGGCSCTSRGDGTACAGGLRSRGLAWGGSRARRRRGGRARSLADEKATLHLLRSASLASTSGRGGGDGACLDVDGGLKRNTSGRAWSDGRCSCDGAEIHALRHWRRASRSQDGEEENVCSAHDVGGERVLFLIRIGGRGGVRLVVEL